MSHRPARLCALAACLLFGAPLAAAEHEWRLAHYLPENHFFAADWLPAWVARVEDATGGRLQITIHPNNELLRLGDIAPGVAAGHAEIGFGPAPDSAALSVLGLPFMVDSAHHGTAVAMRLLADGDLDDDMAGLEVAFLQTNAPSLVHTRGRAVHAPADLEGMRMRGATAGIRALLETLGSEPVEGFLAPQVYDALRDGHVDGTVFPYEAMDVFRLAEQLDHHTEVFLFVAALGLFISADALAALPPDLREAVRAHTGAEMASDAAAAWDEEERRGRDIAVAAGNEIIAPDRDQYALWREAAAPYVAERLERLAASGAGTDALHARVLDIAATLRDSAQR